MAVACGSCEMMWREKREDTDVNTDGENAVMELCCRTPSAFVRKCLHVFFKEIFKIQTMC